MNLESHKFMSFFAPEQAAELCKIAGIDSFLPKQVIFEDGEISDFFFLILAGQLKFRKYECSNQYTIIAQA